MNKLNHQKDYNREIKKPGSHGFAGECYKLSRDK